MGGAVVDVSQMTQPTDRPRLLSLSLSMPRDHQAKDMTGGRGVAGMRGDVDLTKHEDWLPRTAAWGWPLSFGGANASTDDEELVAARAKATHAEVSPVELL